MPKIVVPLTTGRIRAAKPKEKIYKLSDGGGLQLWVKPNGKKVWVIEWQRPDKKLDTMTLGPYPELGLGEAREKRAEIKGLILSGEDPKAQRRKEKEAAGENTFRQVARLWFDRWPATNEKYRNQVWSRLENDVFPKLGNKPVALITASMIVEALSSMENRGVLESLARLRAKIEEILAFALARGMTENNTAAGTKKAFPPPKRKHFRALSPSELPLIVEATRNERLSFPTRMLIRWQLLTLTRSGEAVRARWDEIDLENRIWHIPATRMKMKRPHDIHLSSLAIDVLVQMRRLNGRQEYVFAGRSNPKKSMSTETVRMAFVRLQIDSTAHGLRSLASTAMNEATDPDTGRRMFDPDVIEAALAHLDDDQVRAAYNRALYVEHREELLDWWCEQIRKAGG